MKKPGYIFRPTALLIVTHFLLDYIRKGSCDCEDIHDDYDVYSTDPQTLLAPFPDQTAFFITKRKRKNGNSSPRVDRQAGNGWWKKFGADQLIYSDDELVGRQRTLFYRFKGENKNSGWTMYEYELASSGADSCDKFQQFVICRIKKSRQARSPPALSPVGTPESSPRGFDNACGSASSSLSNFECQTPTSRQSFSDKEIFSQFSSLKRKQSETPLRIDTECADFCASSSRYEDLATPAETPRDGETDRWFCGDFVGGNGSGDSAKKHKGLTKMPTFNHYVNTSDRVAEIAIDQVMQEDEAINFDFWTSQSDENEEIMRSLGNEGINVQLQPIESAVIEPQQSGQSFEPLEFIRAARLDRLSSFNHNSGIHSTGPMYAVNSFNHNTQGNPEGVESIPEENEHFDM